MEGLSPEASEEEVAKRPYKSGYKKKVSEGRFVVPPSWEKWKKVCGAKRRNGTPCARYAVIGLPTCRLHGSGGEKNKELGELRYLCWIITGGTQSMPVEHACRVALATFAEYVLNNGGASINQRLKAAMWLTERLE